MSAPYTLGDGTDEYLDLRGVDKKKYYTTYLRSAGYAWFDIFKYTYWNTKNVWVTVKNGNPYPYVDIPKDCEIVFSLNDIDKCNNFVSLYYNPSLNISVKPTQKKCGCDKCNCGTVCEGVNSSNLTTKVLFTINGVDFIEKTWLKYCPNGDVIEYREVPVKSFNDTTGDNTGDFNSDYNEDSDIAKGLVFANYSIKTKTFQRTIVQLKTRPCGCPEESAENLALLETSCGCYLNNFCGAMVTRCNRFLETQWDYCRSEIKVSMEERRIYIKNLYPGTEFLMINYQVNKHADPQTHVPDLARVTLFDGIDSWSKKYNGAYSDNQKEYARIRFNDSINKLIGDINRVDMRKMVEIQSAPNRW